MPHHIGAELRRTALTAFTSAGRRYPHLTRFGGKYTPVTKTEELTPTELADTLGAAKIVEMLKPLAPLGRRAEPTAMLLEMAKEGRKFYR